MKNYSWPSPFLNEPWADTTPDIPKELVHAVGAVIIAWNESETVQLELLELLLGANKLNSQGTRIFERILIPMGIKQRQDLFLGVLDELHLPDFAKQKFKDFLKHFSICQENRNFVVHSDFIPETFGTLIQNRKARPNIHTRFAPVEASFWEKTIEEVKTLNRFGWDIAALLSFSASEDTWPETPPQPRKLTSILEKEVSAPLPPQSSPA